MHVSGAVDTPPHSEESPSRRILEWAIGKQIATEKSPPLTQPRSVISNTERSSEARESPSLFMESLRNLLLESPKRFKDLYPMIAERHPERCPVQGSKARLTSMGWLNEIHGDLQEIAINRDGVWQLKSTAAARYDREELYERVWSQPMQRLARQYGVSDARAPVRGVWTSSAPATGDCRLSL